MDEVVNILHCCGGHEEHLDSCPIREYELGWNPDED